MDLAEKIKTIAVLSVNSLVLLFSEKTGRVLAELFTGNLHSALHNVFSDLLILLSLFWTCLQIVKHYNATNIRKLMTNLVEWVALHHVRIVILIVFTCSISLWLFTEKVNTTDLVTVLTFLSGYGFMQQIRKRIIKRKEVKKDQTKETA